MQKSSSSGLLTVLSWGVSDNVSTIINAETISELLSSDLVGSLLFLICFMLADACSKHIICNLRTCLSRLMTMATQDSHQLGMFRLSLHRGKFVDEVCYP
mgnify:CR=1 FL=1